MIDFLLKKFVKNYEDTTDSNVRESYGAFAGTVGVVVNVFLAVAKFIAALVSGFAVSVLADALNNFLDAASSLVTYSICTCSISYWNNFLLIFSTSRISSGELLSVRARIPPAATIAS